MIEGIQYLRAIAALMVVGHHARHFFGASLPGWWDFGARGVDIFFVISGFVIAHASRGYDPQRARGPQIREFLVRRFIRVVPLYWIALPFAARFIVGHMDAGLINDVLFLPRYHPVQKTFIAPALMPGWTVNYEVFFYALFALSLAFGELRYRFLSAALICLVVAGWLFDGPAPAWPVYTSPLLLEFLLGVGLNLSFRPDRQISRNGALILLLAGFVGLGLGNPGPKVLLPALYAGAIVLGGIHLCRGWHSRIFRLIGDASYSIYLSHPFAFIVIGRVCHKIGFAEATPISVVLVIALHVIGAAIGGIAVHLLIERPLLGACNSAWARLKGMRTAAAGT